MSFGLISLDIMVNSAQLNDIEDSDWVVNGAGRYVNHKYGFGVVDAYPNIHIYVVIILTKSSYAAVILAQQWARVPEEITLVSSVVRVNLKIPDFSNEGLTSEIVIEDSILAFF